MKNKIKKQQQQRQWNLYSENYFPDPAEASIKSTRTPRAITDTPLTRTVSESPANVTDVWVKHSRYYRSYYRDYRTGHFAWSRGRSFIV